MGEQLAGLVGALEHGVDHGPVGRTCGHPGLEPGAHVRGGAHQGRRAHVALAAQPAQQAGRPLGVLDGEFTDETDVPVVPLLAALVEGPLGDEVADRQEVELLAGLPDEGRPAGVGADIGCAGPVAYARHGGVGEPWRGQGAGSGRDVRGHEHLGPHLGDAWGVTRQRIPRIQRMGGPAETSDGAKHARACRDQRGGGVTWFRRK
ncbi:hypothetical protein GCM10010353_25030 [Streptomyces chryseus]|nr:hypothetical protein GCM10010353_25030 [Streptomyces chryseus]